MEDTGRPRDAAIATGTRREGGREGEELRGFVHVQMYMYVYVFALLCCHVHKLAGLCCMH